tara:strand:+ start:13 stop:435 length:423 start_codon:yes stop_codon:yes gene_type:complete
MNENDIEYLTKAINNESNESLLHLTFDKISKKKNIILHELELPKKKLSELESKLEDYRYVDEIPELHIGNYIRWINLSNPENLVLTNGAILSEVKIEENIILVLKNVVSKKFFQINMEENLLFQKLSDQEKVILYALEHL